MIMIFINVLLVSVGQIILKYGTSLVPELENESMLAHTIKVFFSPTVLAGVAIYAISAVIWVAILGKVKLSLAYPLISSSYVLVVILSAWLLNEKVAGITIIGLIAICVGVSLIGVGSGLVK